jgi:hypothetical protein
VLNYSVEAGGGLQQAAREWQKLQLAVLGFVGLCGVLGGDASSHPQWLRDVSGLAALAGLVVAILGVTIVAVVAHPLSARPMTTATAARRLRTGVVITFVAAGLTALAALSGWWPAGGGGKAPDQVAVTTSSGAACGTVVRSGSGALQLDVDGKRVTLPLARLLSITLVNEC